VPERAFVGFGFGPIQAGLFLCEAAASGAFSRLVVAEIVDDVVLSVRRAGGAYSVNIATSTGIEKRRVSGVEIYNPLREPDREELIRAVAEASELATALPSVRAYGCGRPGDPVDILGRGIRKKLEDSSFPAAVLYAGENHNHAAELLDEALASAFGIQGNGRFQAVNTVIGKMSGVVSDERQMAEQELAPVTPGAGRAFLVEEFNRILIGRIAIPGFRRGIAAFEEKPDLLPFEEAKLYGHNAVHALIGYLLRIRGAARMSDAASFPDILALARDAFLQESGAALCSKYAGLDPLFSVDGFAVYADDLIRRMLNPHLRDSVARVTRDPRRKLGWDDRLVGTMRLALSRGIEPNRFALGAAAALKAVAAEENISENEALESLWGEEAADSAMKRRVRDLIARSLPCLK